MTLVEPMITRAPLAAPTASGWFDFPRRRGSGSTIRRPIGSPERIRALAAAQLRKHHRNTDDHRWRLLQGATKQVKSTALIESNIYNAGRVGFFDCGFAASHCAAAIIEYAVTQRPIAPDSFATCAN